MNSHQDEYATFHEGRQSILRMTDDQYCAHKTFLQANRPFLLRRKKRLDRAREWASTYVLDADIDMWEKSGEVLSDEIGYWGIRFRIPWESIPIDDCTKFVELFLDPGPMSPAELQKLNESHRKDREHLIAWWEEHRSAILRAHVKFREGFFGLFVSSPQTVRDVFDMFSDSMHLLATTNVSHRDAYEETKLDEYWNIPESIRAFLPD